METSKTHLHKSTIGIIAPSFFVEKEEQYSYGLKCLLSFGFKLRIGKLVNKRYYNTTGTAIQRAKELNMMFEDSEVDLIIATDGGSRAIEIIEYLDYDLIKSNPKPMCGFSDITHLLLAIYSKTGNCSIHGMDIINGFGHPSSLTKKQNVTSFFTVLNNSVLNTAIFKGAQVLKHGKASGIVIGGWLNAIHDLYLTKYFPSIDNIILFWEAIDEEPNKIAMMLYSLRVSGFFERVTGMVVGTLTNCVEKEYFDCIPKLETIIQESCEGYNFPIIVNAAFGHGDKNCSFRYGEKIEINTEELEL